MTTRSTEGTVTLTLDALGTDVVREALELYARVAMGQFPRAGAVYGRLYGDAVAEAKVRPALLAAEQLAACSHGIAEAPQPARLAWDLSRVLAGDSPSHYVAGVAPRVAFAAAPEAPREDARARLEDQLVSRISDAMREKLARARAKGRGGWDDPRDCTVEHLWDCLDEHARKENLDMVDVANIAAMIWWRLAHVPGDRERLAAYVAARPAAALETLRVAVRPVPEGAPVQAHGPVLIAAALGAAVERAALHGPSDDVPAPDLANDPPELAPDSEADPVTIGQMAGSPALEQLDVDLGNGRFLTRGEGGGWKLLVRRPDGTAALSFIDHLTAAQYLRDAHARSVAALGRLRNRDERDVRAEVEPRARLFATRAALEALGVRL